MCVSRLKHKTFTRAYSKNEENLLKQSTHSKNAGAGTRARTHTHTHIYIYIYAHTHIYIYTHTHTHTQHYKQISW